MAYPFPDDPCTPDVDLDLDGRWFRHLSSEILDPFAGNARLMWERRAWTVESPYRDSTGSCTAAVVWSR